MGVARQRGALGPHPAFQCGNQRLDPLLSDGMPLLGGGAVDLALDGEDLVDAANRLDRQWRLPQIGQHKELAPAVGPARRFGDPAGSALGVVEIIEAGIGVGLQDTDPAREMPARMLATPVTRVEEHGGRRIAAAARSVIPHVEPALAKAGVHSRPVTVLFLASTGTVVSSPWMRVAARTWRRISSTSGARVALHAPTQSARVDTSSSTPSRA